MPGEKNVAREILRVELDGAVLVGTHHRPGRDNRLSLMVGVLVFNTGFGPRSAGSDLSVRLADRLAMLGYHVFRFDMPGLGDSPGELQEDLASFARFIRDGGHTRWASGLITVLRHQYRLRGLVLAGNCGGAITATYAAARMPDDVLGMIQLDPDFDRAEGIQYGGEKPITRDRAPKTSWHVRMIQAVSHMLRRFPSVFQALRASVIPVRLSIIGLRDKVLGPRLPRSTNFPLLRCWEQVAATELPILVLTAENSRKRVFFYDYMAYLLSKHRHHVASIEIAGTNHLFTSGGGIGAVIGESERWLMAMVPPLSSELAASRYAVGASLEKKASVA
jgi:pimeloyl-ACP methyl ester carboxylesterase